MLEQIRKSLGAKISIAVVAVLAFFFVVLWLVEINSESMDILRSYQRNARSLASTIEKGLISAMKEGRNGDVQKVLDEIGSQEEIVGVRVFDEKGTILRSTNRGELGGMVDKGTLQRYTADDEGRRTMVDRSVYSYLNPIYNAPNCFGCHPSGIKVNGVLEVRVSMEKAYEDIRSNRWFMMKWGVLTVLCVALVEIWLLRFLVTKPVKRLRTAMRKAEKGDDAYRFEVREKDELGDLANAFKGMMKRISDLNAAGIEKHKELVRSEEDARANGLLASVIEAMPDGVAIIDRDMRLVQANPGYMAAFPQAVIGEHCYFCIHGRDQICPHCGVAKVFEDGGVHEHQSTVNMPDGAVKVVHSISAPMKGPDGVVFNAVEVVRDVTERVTLEKELKEKGWELEKANKKLARMAVTDGLTMLYNHRFFQDTLKREFKRLARHRALPLLSLMMIDIDHFKTFNDTYGHQAGDRVLRGMSKVLKDSVRLTDTVARYGGEEFAIIMPETDIEGSGIVAERIRRNVEDAEFPFKDETLKVTVSVGLACYPQEDIKGEDDLIKAADSAMYKAKSLGRNRVVVSVGV